jgi:hypothetical protein
MIYGYARVSTEARDLTSQLAQLKAAGCEKVFREKLTGIDRLGGESRACTRRTPPGFCAGAEVPPVIAASSKPAMVRRSRRGFIGYLPRLQQRLHRAAPGISRAVDVQASIAAMVGKATQIIGGLRLRAANTTAWDSNFRFPVTMKRAGRLAARGGEGRSARFLLLGEPFHRADRPYGFGRWRFALLLAL